METCKLWSKDLLAVSNKPTICLLLTIIGFFTIMLANQQTALFLWCVGYIQNLDLRQTKIVSNASIFQNCLSLCMVLFFLWMDIFILRRLLVKFKTFVQLDEQDDQVENQLEALQPDDCLTQQLDTRRNPVRTCRNK